MWNLKNGTTSEYDEKETYSRYREQTSVYHWGVGSGKGQYRGLRGKIY